MVAAPLERIEAADHQKTLAMGIKSIQGTMNHDLMHGNPGTTFSNILERDEYDPTRHAVVMLSTFREMLHKWVIDVYLQMPHRGIKDTPAHRWQTAMSALPPPLPPTHVIWVSCSE
jgi:putative transposase